MDFLDGAGETASEHDVSSLHAPLNRELDEPEDGFEPVPVIWIMLALALAMGCGWYMASFAGEFRADFYDGDSPAPASNTQVATTPTAADPAVAGRRIFNNCIGCHQQGGQGVAGIYPPLRDSEWVLGDESILARILLHGLQGPVVVQKIAYEGVMPAWGHLTDAQIAHVLTYIRGAWGNSAAPIEPEVVAEQRRLVGDRDAAWTATELKRPVP